MGDGNGKEQEYDEILSPDDFSGSPYLNQSGDEEEYVSKRLGPELSLEFKQEDSAHSSLLGLTLRKTPSFLNLLETRLSKEKKAIDVSIQNFHHDHKHKAKMNDLGSQCMSEKLKASNFPVLFVRIGNWQRISSHEGDLITKLYYAKRKMVWEVLEGALKSKIEIQWTDIIAIRAIMPENEEGTLEIELNQPPLFYRETNPQPRKHTLWQHASDFTGGQAHLWRRHYVRFPPGILDKHYEKLLQCDQRLFSLSSKPFPSQDSPLFDPTIFSISPFSISFDGYESGLQYPYRVYPGYAPHSPISVMDLSFRNNMERNNQQNPNEMVWSPTQGGDGISISHQNYQSHGLDDVSKHLLEDSQVEFSSELMSPTNLEYMYSYSKPLEIFHNGNTIATHPKMNCQVGEVMQRTFIHNSINDYGVYPETWLPSYDFNNESMVMYPTISDSMSFYVPSNPINRDFF